MMPQRKVIYAMEEKEPLSSKIVTDYNRHMGYVNKRNKMANSYSSHPRTIK